MSQFKKIIHLPKRTILHILKKHELQFSPTLRELGLSATDPRARKFLKQLAEEHIPKLLKAKVKQGKLNYSIDEVKMAAASAICYSDICKQLGLAVHGSNYETLRKIITSNNIDVSHFNRSSALKRGRQKDWIYEEVFCVHSKVPRATLRKVAIRLGFLPTECNECKITITYNGKPITLTLDHTNGISDDNRKENLRWLCPNCHSQTDTYCGKNTGKNRK